MTTEVVEKTVEEQKETMPVQEQGETKAPVQEQTAANSGTDSDSEDSMPELEDQDNLASQNDVSAAQLSFVFGFIFKCEDAEIVVYIFTSTVNFI